MGHVVVSDQVLDDFLNLPLFLHGEIPGRHHFPAFKHVIGGKDGIQPLFLRAKGHAVGTNGPAEDGNQKHRRQGHGEDHVQFPLLNDKVDHGEGHPQAQGKNHIAIFREAVLMHPQKPGVVHKAQKGQCRRRHDFSEVVGSGAVPVVIHHKEHEDGEGHGPKDEFHHAGAGQLVQKHNLRHVQIQKQHV